MPEDYIWDQDKTDKYLVSYFTIKRSLTRSYRDQFKTFIKGVKNYIYSEFDFYLSVTTWFESGWSYSQTYRSWLEDNFKKMFA